jgi:hypothetical protein
MSLTLTISTGHMEMIEIRLDLDDLVFTVGAIRVSTNRGLKDTDHDTFKSTYMFSGGVDGSLLC